MSIDLASLPAPEVVETLDFETIYAERKSHLVSLYPIEQQAEVLRTLALDSEPISILLQENAYRELRLRQRVNDAARSLLLAYASGKSLEHLGALLDVPRLVISPATEDSEAVMESDDDLRKRIQLAPEGFSTAGPEGAYIVLALQADGRVLDAAASSPSPGCILVTVLSREGEGIASEEVLAAVNAAVNAEDARPLTDKVTVLSAEILHYEIEARLYTFPGPDAGVVLQEARARLNAYVDDCHRLGREVVLSGLYAALHVSGIERVELVKPAANIAVTRTQAPYCTAISLLHGGTNA